MEQRERRKDWACRAGVALAIVLALTFSWRATTLYGLGIDGDAAWTLSAGSSLASGAGLVTCLGEVFSLWPPLWWLSLFALAAMVFLMYRGLPVLMKAPEDRALGYAASATVAVMVAAIVLFAIAAAVT